jgi:hypothetical protein
MNTPMIVNSVYESSENIFLAALNSVNYDLESLDPSVLAEAFDAFLVNMKKKLDIRLVDGQIHVKVEHG